MDVRLTFTMSDKYDSLRFHLFLSCFSREVVVGGVYSFFLQRAVSPCFGGMLFDYNLHGTNPERIRLNPCSNGMLSDVIIL